MELEFVYIVGKRQIWAIAKNSNFPGLWNAAKDIVYIFFQ